MKSTRHTTTFGGNLRRARVRAGLSQAVLARRIGLRQPTPISLWERSLTIPAPSTIVRLARALGCAPATLLEHVITPYDAIRGYTATVRPDQAAVAVDPSPTLTRADLEWLQAGRAVGPLWRRQLLAVIAEALRERAAGGASPSRTATKSPSDAPAPAAPPGADPVPAGPRKPNHAADAGRRPHTRPRTTVKR